MAEVMKNQPSDLNLVITPSTLTSLINAEDGHSSTIGTTSSKSEVPTYDNLSRQICRSWFKNKYIGSGKPCTDVNCKRKHEIVEKNPERLYKDYAFKGLTGAQRKKIIQQISDQINSNSQP
jgi:hypothetical protein